MPAENDFERALERLTGKTVEYLRETALDKQRQEIERRFGLPMKIVSTRENVLSRSEIEALLDKALDG